MSGEWVECRHELAISFPDNCFRWLGCWVLDTEHSVEICRSLFVVVQTITAFIATTFYHGTSKPTFSHRKFQGTEDHAVVVSVVFACLQFGIIEDNLVHVALYGKHASAVAEHNPVIEASIGKVIFQVVGRDKPLSFMA